MREMKYKIREIINKIMLNCLRKNKPVKRYFENDDDFYNYPYK